MMNNQYNSLRNKTRKPEFGRICNTIYASPSVMNHDNSYNNSEALMTKKIYTNIKKIMYHIHLGFHFLKM